MPDKDFNTKIIKTWCINLNSDEGHGYVGVWYFEKTRKQGVLDHQSGFRTATFRTRVQARKALINIKRFNKKARVERVLIIVKRAS